MTPDSLANTNLETGTVGTVTVPDPVFSCRDVNVYYGDKHAIKHVNIDIARKQVLAMIGPSGCGKSTFLRCLNRMNDTIPNARVTGAITLDGKDIHEKRQDVVQLRARVGMVFQKPNPFPKSIYETSLTVRASTGLRPIAANSTTSSIRVCGARVCGRRSKTASTSRAPVSPAVSSNACASRAPSP